MRRMRDRPEGTVYKVQNLKSVLQQSTLLFNSHDTPAVLHLSCYKSFFFFFNLKKMLLGYEKY